MKDESKQITSHLHPLDLVHLSFTNKLMRLVICNRSVRSVWKASLAAVPSLPECPLWMSEPQYANLVFGKACTVSMTSLQLSTTLIYCYSTVVARPKPNMPCCYGSVASIATIDA